jgi:hypothetical protein
MRSGGGQGNMRYSEISSEVDGGSGASHNNDEDFVEIESDLPELLNQYKFHPLNYFCPKEIVPLGKTDEYHQYSFYSGEFEQTFILKVMTDDRLYDVEKRMFTLLEGSGVTLKLVNSFTFEFPH